MLNGYGDCRVMMRPRRAKVSTEKDPAYDVAPGLESCLQAITCCPYPRIAQITLPRIFGYCQHLDKCILTI